LPSPFWVWWLRSWVCWQIGWVSSRLSTPAKLQKRWRTVRAGAAAGRRTLVTSSSLLRCTAVCCCSAQWQEACWARYCLRWSRRRSMIQGIELRIEKPSLCIRAAAFWTRRIKHY
jgi:hypothetical protein